jgi:hypothetical protein
MQQRKLLIGFIATVALAGSLLLTASPAPAVVFDAPACTGDPVANTRALQATIDQALPGDTVRLPPGDCVVAKCDLTAPRLCYGVLGTPHRSALYIGGRTDLTLIGADDGTSVIRLDPNPSGTPGHHAYCGSTNVLSIQLSRAITLRDFTIDGSNDRLPNDNQQCPRAPGGDDGHAGRIDEHLYNVSVVNGADISVERMQIRQAHGDGLNLIAERRFTEVPATERVSVTDTKFIANGRAGITVQRNVGRSVFSGNYFRGSGNDQDLDMEPTGGPEDRGPYDVTVDRNVFERLQGRTTVALGATGGIQPASGVRFTNNIIRPSPLASPQTGGGGCIFVYAADNTLIAANTVIGARGCVAISAQRARGLQVLDNHVEGLANLSTAAGVFKPSPVISVVERVVNQGDTNVCGEAPKPPCPYGIHYPEHVQISGNAVFQHVPSSPGIVASNADDLVVTDNLVESTRAVPPSGSVPAGTRAVGLDLLLGVRNLPSYGFYVNERTAFQPWTISGNELRTFDDGVHVRPAKPAVTLAAATMNGNEIGTVRPAPRGIFLEAAQGAPDVGYVGSLTVAGNRFGCGFTNPGSSVPLPRAFVRPAGQSHSGDIGTVAPCT